MTKKSAGPRDRTSSFSKSSDRARALAHVRSEVAAGRAKKADLDRWTKELGPAVAEIVAELKPKPDTKPAGDNTEKGAE